MSGKPLFAQSAPDTQPLQVLVLYEKTIMRGWEQRFIHALWTETPDMDNPRTTLIQYESLNDRSVNDSILATQLKKKHAANRFAVIIGLLPGACSFLVNFGDSLWPDVPILFIAPRPGDLKKALANPKNIVLKSQAAAAIASTFQDIVTIRPNLRELILVGGSSAVDSAYLHIFTQQLSVLPSHVQVHRWRGLPLDELLQRAAQLDPQYSAIMLGSYDMDTQGRTYNLDWLVHRLSSASRAPLFSFFDSPWGSGLTGGTLSSAADYGKSAHRILTQIAKKITVAAEQSPPPPQKQYFWKNMQRFGIAPQDLPPDSKIIGRPQVLWEQYPHEVHVGVGIFLGLSFMIAGLLWVVRQQRRTEASLRNSEQLLEAVFQTAPIPLFLINARYQVVKSNQTQNVLQDKFPQQERHLLGYSLGCCYALPNPDGCGNTPYCASCQIRCAIAQTFKDEKGIQSLEVELHPSSQDAGAPHSFLLSTAYLTGIRMVFLVLQDITALKESQQHLQLSLNEREALIKELYHRTRNNMNVIAAMVELEFDDSPLSDIRRKSASIISRIHAMALVHDMLYQSKNLSRISLSLYLTKLSNRIHSSFPAIAPRISLHQNLQSDLTILIDLAVPCGLIVNELLTNCYEHAFPDFQEGTITLAAKQYDAKHMVISVTDTGVGLPSAEYLPSHHGIGLSSARRIVEHQLRGKFQLDSSPEGLHAQMIIPMDSYTERV